MPESRIPLVSAGPVHHVTVGVSDLDKSIIFYRDGLGLRKTLDTVVGGIGFSQLLRLREGSSARTVFMQGKSRVGQVELVEWRNGEDQIPKPIRPGSPGVCVLSFSVEAKDFESILAQLRTVSATFWGDPVISILDGYGEIEACIVEDPDGNAIEIVCLPSDEQVKRFRSVIQTNYKNTTI